MLGFHWINAMKKLIIYLYIVFIISTHLYAQGVAMNSKNTQPYFITGPLTPEEQLALFPKCVKEADHAPALDPELDARFKALRKRESKRYLEDEDKRQITQAYEELAAAGHWKAKYNLALRYQTGTKAGADFSYEAALQLLEPMAVANIPIGIYGMALAIRDGKGVKRDITLASQYTYRAAELGSPQAQYYLGMEAYGRYDFLLAKNYLSCAAHQGNKEAAYQLAGIIRIGEQNYPKSAYYDLLAASLGHEVGFISLWAFFNDQVKDGVSRYGYTENPEFTACIREYGKQLSKDSSLTFPNLAKDCPLPLHPLMGDGSTLPDLESRMGGFLERLQNGTYDPVEEKRRGDEKVRSLQKEYWQRQKSASAQHTAKPQYKTIPLEGLDQWTMEQVQSGEYFVKRDRTWIYVKDGAEVPSRISGYLESVLNTHYVNVLEVEAFHEETDGQFKAMLRTMLG